MRPAFLECTACSKRTEVGLVDTGSVRGASIPPFAASTVHTAEEARAYLGLKPRAS